ncbi:MAG: hypothetical protein QNK36_10335 [Colwellia sp.]|nr:hypothetical protein [Colwellia sp.]
MSEQTISGNKSTGVSKQPIDVIVGIIFAGIFMSLITLVILTIFMQQEGICIDMGDVNAFMQVICWFDPIFMAYNILLLLLIVMVAPSITFFYVHNKRVHKENRLRESLGHDEESKKKIKAYLDESFKMRHYAGSMTLLSIVILLGGAIILLLKPMTISSAGFGVDYSKGANFLMLGSYMHHFVEDNTKEYMRVLIGTLTAFQFGFLGAYVYFIIHIVRSYFTLDLSPSIYTSCTVRIMMGAILSLVLSFFVISGQIESGIGDDVQEAAKIVMQQSSLDTMKPPVPLNLYYYLPIISFFIGFFPLRGLLVLERAASSLLHILPTEYHSTSLTDLTGMSYQHEIRLNREGFDNVENFVTADVVDLTMRTGFSYQQLLDWRSQAELIVFLGNDYDRFRQATSIDSVIHLKKNANWFVDASNTGALIGVIDELLYQKVRIILNTLQ